MPSFYAIGSRQFADDTIVHIPHADWETGSTPAVTSLSSDVIVFKVIDDRLCFILAELEYLEFTHINKTGDSKTMATLLENSTTMFGISCYISILE